MTSADFTSLAIVLTAALGAAFLADAARKLLVPLVVVEIVLGVVIGPGVLGMASVTPQVGALAQLGVCLLFFLAGIEIRIERLGGWPTTLPLVAWLASLAIAVALSLLLDDVGLITGAAAVTLALTTTALGILVPVLRESGLLGTPLGAATLEAGTMAWVGPLVVLPLVLAPGHAESLMVGLFAFVAAIAIAGTGMAQLLRVRGRLPLRRVDRPTSQLAVRAALVLLLGFCVLAVELHVSALFGAFAAGILLRATLPPKGVNQLRERLGPIGFGLFIPVFFVTTGMSLYLGAFDGRRGVLLVLLFLVAFVLVRGTPALLYWRRLGRRQAAALGFFAATKLPLLVAIVSAARRAGEMDATTGSALVAAAMVSVVVFPASARHLTVPAEEHKALGAAAENRSP